MANEPSKPIKGNGLAVLGNSCGSCSALAVVIRSCGPTCESRSALSHSYLPPDTTKPVRAPLMTTE
jgi:hypothetical protein